MPQPAPPSRRPVLPINKGPIVKVKTTTNGTMDPLVVEFDLSGSFDPEGDAIVGWSIYPQAGSKEATEVQLDPLAANFQKKLVHVLNRDGVGPILQPGYATATIVLTDSKGYQSKPTTVRVNVDPYVAQ